MTGEWVRRGAAAHRCNLPDVSTARPGDLWRCGCGELYVVKVNRNEHYLERADDAVHGRIDL